MSDSCPICQLHAPGNGLEAWRNARWVLRHHPLPVPIAGWAMLDAVRHVQGPADFTAQEQAEFGDVLARASRAVRAATGCERVYAIAFGESVAHMHMHLVPRFAADPESAAWKVADLYRAVIAGTRPAADARACEAACAKIAHGMAQ